MSVDIEDCKAWREAAAGTHLAACAALSTALVMAVMVAAARGDDEYLDPPPPPVTSVAWYDWYDAVLASRRDVAEFDRDETRYVSSSGGDDDADGLTPATAWATLGRAETWINSSNPSGVTREALLRRGDTWRRHRGIVTFEPGVRVADYGSPDLPRPFVSAFTLVVGPNDGAWSSAGNGVYSRPEPEAISWVREDGDLDLDMPLSHQEDLDGVTNTIGSWWWDGGADVLYVHPRNGDDPRTNGRLYEATLTGDRGFSMGGHGSLVENIRADGFGLQPGFGGSLKEAFQSRTSSDGAAMFRNCVSFYGQTHIMTHLNWYAGGVATFIECTAGFTTLGPAGETIFNTYSMLGGQRTIFHECTVARGTLPAAMFEGKRADPFYGHTNGQPESRLGVTVVYGLRVLDHPYGCLRTGRFGDVPVAKSVADARVFVVGTVHEGGSGTGDQLCPLVAEGVAYVNCRYTLFPEDAQPARLQITRADGWWINSVLDVDLSHQTASTFSILGASYSDQNPRFWHSVLLFRNVPAGLTVRIMEGGPDTASLGTLMNTIVARIGGDGNVNVNLPDALANVAANAYWQVAPPSADVFAVELDSPPALDAAPGSSSPLVGAAHPLPELEALEYDNAWRDRTNETIGPLEFIPDGDANGDGAVDVRDLLIVIAAWGPCPVDPCAGDLDHDGLVGETDLVIVVSNWD